MLRQWILVGRERVATRLRSSPFGLWLLDELPEPPDEHGVRARPVPDPDIGKPEHVLETEFMTEFDEAAAKGDGSENLILVELDETERRREGSIRSVAADANALLSALAFIVVTLGLLFGSKINLFLDSPGRHFVWLVGVAFILIIRSHTVRFVKSWLTDYDDAGKRAAKVVNKRISAQRKRKVVNRLNAVSQRAKRKQSLAVLLLSIAAIAICAYVSFG